MRRLSETTKHNTSQEGKTVPSQGLRRLKSRRLKSRSPKSISLKVKKTQVKNTRAKKTDSAFSRVKKTQGHAFSTH